MKKIKKIFRKLDKELSEAIQIEKKTYFAKKVKNCNKEPKKLWNFINNDLYTSAKKCSDRRINKINIDGYEVQDDQEMADLFSEFLYNAPRNIVNSISNEANDFTKYMPDPAIQSFYCPSAWPVEVAEIIENLNNKTSKDIFGLSNHFVKKIAFEISIPLSYIFNLSMTTGRFPTKWKEIKLIPIFKNKGSNTDMNNYRPIALTCIFAKIFDKYVNKWLYSYLETFSILRLEQFGFRKNTSVHEAIISLLNNISNAKNLKLPNGVLFLDCQKAFDTIDRKILLAKLENIGIRENVLLWFESYLTGRMQRVEVNGLQSRTAFNSDLGVLQGSALSATLFLIYINDFPNSPNCLNFMYADDIAIFCKEKDATSLKFSLESALTNAHKWYNANNISLNIQKTELLVQNHRAITEDFSVQGPGNDLKINMCSKPARYLGVYISQTNQFNYFFQQIIKRMSNGVYALQKSRYLLDEKTKLQIYNCLVHSHIEFSCLYLHLATRKIITKIFQIQKTAVRAIKNIPPKAHTSNIFENLSILPVELQATLNICKFMRKCNYNTKITGLSWVFNSEIKNKRSAKISEKVHVPFTSRDHLLKYPYFNYPKIYNEHFEHLNLINQRDLFVEFKRLLLLKFKSEQECKIYNCYICKKYKDELSFIQREKQVKLIKRENLIKRKGIEKKERFAKLVERLGEAFVQVMNV